MKKKRNNTKRKKVRTYTLKPKEATGEIKKIYDFLLDDWADLSPNGKIKITMTVREWN